MKTINTCPSTLQPGFAGYSPHAIKSLFDGTAVSPFLDFDFEKDIQRHEVRDNMNNMSISGAQEKFSAVIDDGRIRLSHDGEQATHILKPAPLNFRLYTRKQIPANEHVTMLIASHVYGIRTAACGLCFSRSGQQVYITKRFDVNGGVKDCMQEDFASILMMTEQGSDSSFKYHGHYALIADAIKKIIPAWLPPTEQFFKMVVFNYIFGNEDAHMKNFSLVNKGGEYFLAPAYDLINTCVHISSNSDLALIDGLAPDIEKSDSYDRTGHPCRKDFERFAERIGLPAKRTGMVLDMFMTISPTILALIDASFMSDKMKRSYKRILNERHNRFMRES